MGAMMTIEIISDIVASVPSDVKLMGWMRMLWMRSTPMA
jgi:hypothetical protein